MEINEIEKILAVEKQNLIELLPKQFHEKIRENIYICGGCIYSLRHDEEPNDFDFFLKSEDLANELIEYFKAQEVAPFKNLLQGKYKGLNLLISKYAITLGKYQIITKYIGEPLDVVMQFDFKHNMFYYYDGYIHNAVDWEFLETNRISYNENRARDICGTILRIAKFSKRGMSVPKKEVAKMLKKLEENGFDEREKEIINNYNTY